MSHSMPSSSSPKKSTQLSADSVTHELQQIKSRQDRMEDPLYTVLDNLRRIEGLLGQDRLSSLASPHLHHNQFSRQQPSRLSQPHYSNHPLSPSLPQPSLSQSQRLQIGIPTVMCSMEIMMKHMTFLRLPARIHQLHQAWTLHLLPVHWQR